MSHQTESGIPLLLRAAAFADRVAVIDAAGAHTYQTLDHKSRLIAGALLRHAGVDDLAEARVTYLAAPGVDHVAVQWGIWRAGGIAVPHCHQHPTPELEYVASDTAAELLIADDAHHAPLAAVAQTPRRTLLRVAELYARQADDLPLPQVAANRRALIIYTSGTTSRPKGAVSTHAIIAGQVRSLVEAWQWAPTDHILHVLPLHHIHGIVNVMCCALWSGATCRMLPRFDATAVWDLLGESSGVTLFMAVPTIYAMLIKQWEQADAATQQRWSAGARALRLMVSGSAALPTATLARWRELTGQTLLERYGMTEIGMGLSNPYAGERRAGTVGQPLPEVDARLVDDQGRVLARGVEPREVATPGEIQVRGPAVFQEYWGKPDATRAAFTDDGYFRTGDVAVLEDGYYRILGRQSVDIIKTGGYKVSALEVEEALREHPAIDQAAVVGLEDAQWGQCVAAAVVLRDGQQLELAELRDWCKQRLASYKCPTRLRVLPELPRNAMGKVTKPAVVAAFAG